MFRNGREKENFHETIFFFSLETLVVTHMTKEKNIAGFFCHKLRFCNPCISATRCYRPFTFQTKNSDITNRLSLKYKWFTAYSCKNKVIVKLEFVA